MKPDQKILRARGVQQEPAPSVAQTAANERRESRRHLTVLRIARLESNGVEGLGIVRNVSEGGIMIDAHATLVPGQSLAVSLVDETRVSGRVVWIEGATIGIQFDRKIEVDSILAKSVQQRNGRPVRPPRLRSDRPASLATEKGAVAATIQDVSQRGAKLRVDSGDLAPGADIVVRLADLDPVRGTVRWTNGSSIGVEFLTHLPVQELLKWLPRRCG
jgi:hypothetical protein